MALLGVLPYRLRFSLVDFHGAGGGPGPGNRGGDGGGTSGGSGNSGGDGGSGDSSSNGHPAGRAAGVGQSGAPPGGMDGSDGDGDNSGADTPPGVQDLGTMTVTAKSLEGRTAGDVSGAAMGVTDPQPVVLEDVVVTAEAPEESFMDKYGWNIAGAVLGFTAMGPPGILPGIKASETVQTFFDEETPEEEKMKALTELAVYNVFPVEMQQFYSVAESLSDPETSLSEATVSAALGLFGYSEQGIKGALTGAALGTQVGQLTDRATGMLGINNPTGTLGDVGLGLGNQTSHSGVGAPGDTGNAGNSGREGEQTLFDSPATAINNTAVWDGLQWTGDTGNYSLWDGIKWV